MITTIAVMILDWFIVSCVMLLIINVSFEIRKSLKEKNQ